MLITLISINDGGRKIAIRADFVLRVLEDQGETVIVWRDRDRNDSFHKIEKVEDSFDTVVSKINEVLNGK